jgi:hypothetical protein
VQQTRPFSRSLLISRSVTAGITPYQTLDKL